MDGKREREMQKRCLRPQSNRVLTAMLLMAGTHAALAAGPAEEELVVFQTRAAVSIDAMGRPTDIQLPEQLPEAVASFVRNQITQWRFLPPDVDGQPRAGKTFLTLGACAAPVADGYQLAIDYKGAGPGAPRPDGRSPPPQYPLEAVKQQVGGRGLVQFLVEPDGSVTLETVEFKPARSQRLFQQAIEDWVEQLRFMPEEVDGKPVRTRMRMPLHFERRLRGTVAANAKADKPECTALMKQGDEQRPVALDSPFRRLEGGG
ncbi:TonB family protein [Pseudoxanthomonas sp. z9]|uniref:TonB family protein n=1 Tax=Pseudoxanthomonas sp. z9 TaxID=2584942 RepID=UPI001142ADE7|nr:TonB family protein [Pseudoxanthomonas sp. z9]